VDELDIRLEKTEYLAGEEAKGTIIISVEKDSEFKIENSMFKGKKIP
jgi:hypothetical protein